MFEGPCSRDPRFNFSSKPSNFGTDVLIFGSCKYELLKLSSDGKEVEEVDCCIARF